MTMNKYIMNKCKTNDDDNNPSYPFLIIGSIIAFVSGCMMLNNLLNGLSNIW